MDGWASVVECRDEGERDEAGAVARYLYGSALSVVIRVSLLRWPERERGGRCAASQSGSGRG
jgi:hypothetical protein